MIKAHEIQGVHRAREQLQPRRPRPRRARQGRLDGRRRAACSACTRDEIINAVSLAWVDGQSLRTYRHAPNTGSRKSWAAGDATVARGAPRADREDRRDGLPVGADARRPGASTTCCSRATPFKFQRPYGSYVMENVLFKICFPAEFHAQTAVECAMQLHPLVARPASPTSRRSRSARTSRRSASSTRRGRSPIPADRDHCIQYMVAVPLIFGRLTAADYEDGVAADPRIDALRDEDGLRRGPAVHAATTSIRSKRSIANAHHRRVQRRHAHRRRSSSNTRSATAAAARKAFRCWSRSSAPTSRAASPRKQQQAILDVALDAQRLDAMPVHEFVDLMVH